jgi:hypothetical protein
VIDMALLSVIRRWHCREHLSIREICRRTGLSRNTIRKYLRLNGVEPKFKVPDGTFSRADFAWDAENNRYICPAGKELKQFHRTYATPRSGITAEGTRLHRKDCDACELKQRCCPNMPMRKIPRDLNEDARDVARAIAATPEYEQSRHRRKKVEMLFAHLKRILRMARLRLRGPCGARNEFLLAATAQNLRRLAKLRPPRPPCGVIAEPIPCARAQGIYR